MKQNKQYYSIGEVADLGRIPIKTLRYYDEIGLLVPCFRDAQTNYRHYSASQLPILFIIKKLKAFGFSLDDIKKITQTPDIAYVMRQLEGRSAQLKEKIASLETLNHDLEATIARMRMGTSFINSFDDPASNHKKDYWDEILLENIPLFNCIFTRQVETNYNNSADSFNRWTQLLDLAQKHKLRTIGVITSTYHNAPLDQFVKNDCDLEVSLPVFEALDAPFFKISGGYRAVTTIHIGSHATLIHTHIKAIKWINANGYQICGPISEQYIISPMDVTNEEDYVTKLIIPVCEADSDANA